MRVFISWSGSRSQDLALALRKWLPEVLSEVQPFVSSEDVDKGGQWNLQISTVLDEISEGIICLTPENQDRPWINFEAGALAKSVASARVRPLLLGLSFQDLRGPLATFQATDVQDRSDMLKLVKSLNARCEHPMPDERVETIFRRSWEDFRGELARIPGEVEEHATHDTATSTLDLLGEILNVVRDLRRYDSALDDRSVMHREPSAAADASYAVAETADVPSDVETSSADRTLMKRIRPGVVVWHVEFGRGVVREIHRDGNGLSNASVVIDFPDKTRRVSVIPSNLKITDPSNDSLPNV